ncbi:MAG: PilZ domain-containing protein [Isosphaeraceae bacterium]
MPDSPERRSAPRLAAVKNQATLEFKGRDGQQRAKVSLANISRNGALIVTDERLPLCQTMWFRMESPAKTDWIGVVPVREDRPRQIGIRFVRPCLDDLLLAAMLGIDLGDAVFPDGRPPTFAD